MIIGNKVRCRAIIGTRSHLDKLCLENVQGEYVNDHEWIPYSSRFDMFEEGDCIAFTARITQYMGVENCGKIVDKIGLKTIRDLRLSYEKKHP